MKKGIIAAFAVAVGLAACKEPLDIGSFSVDGQWRGTTFVPTSPTDSVAYTFRLDLDQDNSSVRGSGVISSAVDSVEVSAVGTWAFPNVTLQLSAPEYANLRFNAAFARQVSRDSLVGPLVGSGFDGRSLTLVRQAP